jgi:hypothetical protein
MAGFSSPATRRQCPDGEFPSRPRSELEQFNAVLDLTKDVKQTAHAFCRGA